MMNEQSKFILDFIAQAILILLIGVMLIGWYELGKWFVHNRPRK